MSISVTEAELADMMTSSLRSEPFFVAAAQAIQPEFRSVCQSADQVLMECAIGLCSDDVLLHIATEFRVDFYDSTLPRDQREALILGAPQWLARGGTPSVIDEVLSKVFQFSQVQENWEYGGHPYHFRVTTSDTTTDSAKIAWLYSIVRHLKNVRSIFDGVFRFGNANVGPVYIGLLIGQATHQLIRVTR